MPIVLTFYKVVLNEHDAIHVSSLWGSFVTLFYFFSPHISSLKKASIGFENMFEEVPIVIKNSHLISVLMWELEDKSTVSDKHELLNLSSRSDLSS